MFCGFQIFEPQRDSHFSLLNYSVGAKDIKISNTDTIVEHLDAKGVVGIQNMSPIHNRRRARGGKIIHENENIFNFSVEMIFLFTS